MPEYSIVRWDAVISPKHTFPNPMIYIKPDKDFIEYAKENKYAVLITVKGTGSDYDKNPMVGIIDSSGYFPNFRPFFYNDTGYFVITLISSRWLGYPPSPGTVLIQGMKGPDKVTMPPPRPFQPPIPIELFTQDKKSCGLSTLQIAIILICIIVLLGGLFLFSYFWK